MTHRLTHLPAAASVRHRGRYDRAIVAPSPGIGSTAAVMGAAAGAVLASWGVAVVASAGLGGALRIPVVSVAGYTATAITGLLVGAAGAVLLAAAASGRRSITGAVAVALSAVAVWWAVVHERADGALAAGRDHAIAVLVLTGVTAAVALVVPDTPVGVRSAIRWRARHNRAGATTHVGVAAASAERPTDGEPAPTGAGAVEPTVDPADEERAVRTIELEDDDGDPVVIAQQNQAGRRQAGHGEWKNVDHAPSVDDAAAEQAAVDRSATDG
ncbi:MAG: hypothetical protein R2713_09325 [Ilumatobacteraceae bacterium]